MSTLKEKRLKNVFSILHDNSNGLKIMKALENAKENAEIAESMCKACSNVYSIKSNMPSIKELRKLDKNHYYMFREISNNRMML